MKKQKCKKCKKETILIAENDFSSEELDWYCEECTKIKIEIPDFWDLKEDE